MTSEERFAANLREARKQSGLRQWELAEKCGLHRTEISLLERGGREPRLMTVLALAEGLNVGIADLCVGVRSSRLTKP